MASRHEGNTEQQAHAVLKAVVPTAGLGARLLSVTKEQPKEMLPVFASNGDGELCLRPMVQLVYEQLHDFGFKEFCFIVGRSKRAIEDHFTPDQSFLERLNDRGGTSHAKGLSEFYQKIENSAIVWLNQPQPKGFGHAVLLAEPFVGANEFLVHAGDTYIVSRADDHLSRVARLHRRRSAEATLLLERVEDPREYGVAEVKESGEGDLLVTGVEEKPKSPRSNLAIMPLYVFKPRIFEALRSAGIGHGKELQLTDGIQKLIEWGCTVCATQLSAGEFKLDIGTPETYWQAQSLSHANYRLIGAGRTPR